MEQGELPITRCRIMGVEMKSEQGQALFEFIVFLPLVLVLCGVLLVTGNSINASINQQKATRAYFYMFNQHNSRLPNARILKSWKDESGLVDVGHFALGWAEKIVSRLPHTTCFKYNALFGDIKQDETCDEPDLEENQTSYIRPATAYGVCGETYSLKLDDGAQYREVWLAFNGALNKLEDCVNRKN
jgi:hypothetical protein